MSDDITSLPPQNLDAEKALIAAVLHSNDAIDEVLAFVDADKFYGDAHGKIWSSVAHLWTVRNVPVDLVTLAEELHRRGQLAEIGGPAYITEVSEAAPHGFHARYYAQIVHNKWTLREVIYATTAATRAAYAESNDSTDVILQLDKSVQGLLAPASAKTVMTISDAMQSMYQSIASGQQDGLPTGFAELDKMIGGLPPCGTTVLAARTSIGKTSLALGIGGNVAKRGIGVHVFSLEMAHQRIAERIVSGVCEMPSWAVRHLERVDGFTQERIRHGQSVSADLPIWIDDDSRKTVPQICAAARLAKRRNNIGLVIVDYLQIIPADDPRQPREQQVASASRALRALARQLEIPVLALCQLNRGADQRKGSDADKRPRLSDIRESGSIEQDADAVLLLHRPNFGGEGDQTQTELIVGKNRDGQTGVVRLQFVPDRMGFKDAGPAFEESLGRFEGNRGDD